MAKFPLKHHKFKNRDEQFQQQPKLISIITGFFTFVYPNVQRKVEKSVQSKLAHSLKHGREKILHFKASINITIPNYSVMPENCFKFLLRTQLMNDIEAIYHS